jgi:hypothetical protein
VGIQPGQQQQQMVPEIPDFPIRSQGDTPSSVLGLGSLSLDQPKIVPADINKPSGDIDFGREFVIKKLA